MFQLINKSNYGVHGTGPKAAVSDRGRAEINRELSHEKKERKIKQIFRTWSLTPKHHLVNQHLTK